VLKARASGQAQSEEPKRSRTGRSIGSNSGKRVGRFAATLWRVDPSQTNPPAVDDTRLQTGVHRFPAKPEPAMTSWESSDIVSCRRVVDGATGEFAAAIGRRMCARPAMTRRWGNRVGHRIVCGDCTDEKTVRRLVGDVVPHLMVNDRPKASSTTQRGGTASGSTRRTARAGSATTGGRTGRMPRPWSRAASPVCGTGPCMRRRWQPHTVRGAISLLISAAGPQRAPLPSISLIGCRRPGTEPFF
jgi:hypothetical protein